MHKNLKSFDFITTACILVYAIWDLFQTSAVDVSTTLKQLTLFAWGIIGCMRIDERNRKEKDKEV